MGTIIATRWITIVCRIAHSRLFLRCRALLLVVSLAGTVALVDRGWPEAGRLTSHRTTSVFAGFRSRLK